MDFPFEDPLGMPPELWAGLDWFFECWQRLSADRQGGFAPRGTPFAAREDLMDRLGLDSVSREEMHYYFDRLDGELIEYHARRTP